MDNEQGLGRFRPKLICLAVASCFTAGTALANPTGHTVVRGNVTVKEVGNLLKIHNSPNAVINWRSFSVGANEITRFIQESRNSAVLNRVTGVNGLVAPSEILGTLRSNGKVYLLNSAGVLFGAGSTVDVAGLVASSLKLSDSDFQANRLRFTDGAGAGTVANHGNINTDTGGEVYLVGSAVTNGGVITSPKGHVVLAAGKQVELVNPGTPNLRVEINAPDNQVLNLGDIVAESGRIGIYAGLINNSGTIRADSAVAEGGRILLKAAKEIMLESSSVLDASGQGGGTIEVLAKDGGTVSVAGRLDASAPTGGDGGFIETSATDVNVATGTVVTTEAPYGKTGMWLVDPNNYRVASYGGDITGAQLSTSLNSTNVTLSSDMGATAGSGDVIVDDSVSWGSANSLTLLARNDVNVNQSIINEGNGAIQMYAGWNGSSPTTPAVVNGTGSIFLDSSVRTEGNISLIAGNQVFQNGIGTLGANGLLAIAGSGGVYLSSAVNDVSRIAGRARDGFYFYNGRTLAVGEVGGVSGITVEGGDFAQVNVYVSGNQAQLNVSRDITANAAAYGGQIYLSTGAAYGGGEINVRNAALRATGGSDVESGSYIALYGDTIRIENSTVKAAGRYADVDVYAFGPGGVNVQNSTLEAQASASAQDGGSAYVDIATGISGGSVLVEGSTITAKGRSATAFLEAYGGSVTVKTSKITATGNEAAYGGIAGVGILAGNNVNIGTSAITANGNISVLEPPVEAARASQVFVPVSGSGIAVLAEGGDISLGSLSTNGTVLASSAGKIVDGNDGANIAAPVAFLFGAGGVGATGNPLETKVGSMLLAANSGQIGIANSGDLRLEVLSFGGSDAVIGTTGKFTLGTPVSVPGNLELRANNGMVVDQNVSAGGDLFLTSGGGDLGIFGVLVHGHNVRLQGNSILVGSTTGTAPTSVIADHLVTGNTALNFNIIGGAGSSASSVVRGEDVDLTVGGAINISGGSAYAQIESTSPTTITLTFPNLTSGGFFVNGAPGAISDGNTGFFAGGQPAVLGQSLIVTYGGSNPIVEQNTNQVVDGMNNAGSAPKDETLTLSDPNAPEDQKDKSLPVCK